MLIYPNRYQAKKRAPIGYAVAKIYDGGYAIMPKAQYKQWKEKLKESEGKQ